MEIEAVVEGVKVDMTTGNTVVLVKERDGDKRFPIYVEIYVALHIAKALGHIDSIFQSASMHEIMASVMSEYGIEVKRIVINRLPDDTYVADLHFGKGDRTFTVRSRSSDAIALAQHAHCPIFAESSLFESYENKMREVRDSYLDKTAELILKNFDPAKVKGQ